MKAGTAAGYVQRLALATPCSGRSRALRSAVDLSGILAHAPSLAELVRDLFLPFERLGGVDQVVALRVELAADERGDGGDGEQPTHRFTSALAGAMAGAKHCAYGELTVLRTAERLANRSRKRSRSQAAEQARDQPERRCERIVSVDIAELGLSVEMKRRTVTRGSRLLLVVDWIDEVETIMAARDAVLQLGGDVAGVSVAVASGSHLLQILKAAQIPYACAWTPPYGGELAIGSRRHRSAAPHERRCICHQPQKALKATSGGGLQVAKSEAKKAGPRLAHFTAQYQANAPCEDRSLNIIKEGNTVRAYAVFDGHGGTLAVEHVKSTLCQHILDTVSPESSTEETVSMMSEAFMNCDQDLKQSLLALSPDVRMSKGYCNAGSCAVVALFVGPTLFVANVGDCAAVVGKVDGSDPSAMVRGVQVSVDHSCSNAAEVRLVLARSRDRHPIRLSKDDQGNSGELTLGVKRVAGSLAVTRAFGDFYLKCEELSTAPFKSKLPYITVEPSVSTIELDGSEKYLVLASDGLWEVLTPDEAVQIVHKFDPTQELFFSTASAALIHSALEKIAHRDGMLLHELLALPQGAERRRIHDDITCTVIYIDHQQRNPGSPVADSKISYEEQ